MKFIKLEMVGKNGGPGGSYYAVPEKVIGVASIMAPTSITDKEGQPVLMARAGLDLGYKIPVINMTQEELVKKLEDWEAGEA